MRNPLAVKSPRTIALIAGVALFVLLVVLGEFQGEPQPAGRDMRIILRTAAVAVLMAVWWISEAVPLAVTAMLPMVLLPPLGVMSGKDVAPEYFSFVTFLFIGGFIVALAMQRWNLHKRIALRILIFFGVQPRRILLGFMVATAFLSMWISNTAATMMMVTIVTALLAKLEDSAGEKTVSRLAIAVLLGVAYSASIGGIATLVGTPTNLSFVRIFDRTFEHAPTISFVTWFVFALPLSALMLTGTWLLLAYLYVPRDAKLEIDQDVLHKQYAELGPMSFAEKVVLADFSLLVLLWLSRKGWAQLFSQPKFLNDGTVAIAVAMLLFLVPARPGSSDKVMDWATAVKLPWGIVLLFGGGFALAAAFTESGLSAWLGDALKNEMHPLLLLGLICLVLTFLTELTSNTATAEMILPVLAALAVGMQLNPLFLMIPVSISCSCAFMMPVATPPNAIVFGTGRLRIPDMARTGLALNFAGVTVVVLGMYLYGRWVWGIDFGQLPDWATIKK